jgi:hypothetical protein
VKRAKRFRQTFFLALYSAAVHLDLHPYCEPAEGGVSTCLFSLCLEPIQTRGRSPTCPPILIVSALLYQQESVTLWFCLLHIAKTMSALEKLLIRGIRSFDDKQASVIEFYSPVTVIVGHNGSGKTVSLLSFRRL